LSRTIHRPAIFGARLRGYGRGTQAEAQRTEPLRFMLERDLRADRKERTGKNNSPHWVREVTGPEMMKEEGTGCYTPSPLFVER
jgi:hypothetical protein